MNELCHLWQSERYVACGDDARRGPSRAKRARFPLVPPFGDAACGGSVQLPAEPESSYYAGSVPCVSLLHGPSSVTRPDL